MSVIVGIDPGLFGALAVLATDGSCELVADLPIIREKSLAWINGAEFQSTILGALQGRTAVAFVERVSSMPGQGIASSFLFGVGFGAIIAPQRAAYTYRVRRYFRDPKKRLYSKRNGALSERGTKDVHVASLIDVTSSIVSFAGYRSD